MALLAAKSRLFYKHFTWQTTTDSCPWSSRKEKHQDGGLERGNSNHRFTGKEKGDTGLTFWAHVCQVGRDVSEGMLRKRLEHG